jgi:ABC-type antimicrobial peptide transport system permease subunit
VVGFVLRDGLWMATGGVIAGAAIALIVLAVAAAYVPARRASRLDPLQALR